METKVALSDRILRAPFNLIRSFLSKFYLNFVLRFHAEEMGELKTSFSITFDHIEVLV